MVFRFHALPAEVFIALTTFLAGSDLLSLSHVSSALLTELLPPNGDVWMQRLSAAEAMAIASAKQWYCTRREILFAGSVPGVDERGGAIAIPSSVSSVCDKSSFSISLWFAMHASPTSVSGVHAGGVLLGAQSYKWNNPWWPHFHQQFIHIDPHGNLYCSVTDSKEVVASNLEAGHWYHLALTYARFTLTGNRTQRVYLDGAPINTHARPLHFEWRDVENWQLGSGCISGTAKGKPTQDYCGWYGFRGLIDSFCVRNRVLSAKEIQQLSRGGRLRGKGDVLWCQRQTLEQGTTQLLGNAVKVGHVSSHRVSSVGAEMLEQSEQAQRGTGRRRRLRRVWRRGSGAATT